MNNTNSALNLTHGAFSVARVEGVLFDIDDTLVDLNTASIQGSHHLTAEDFREVLDSKREEVARDYADDGAGAYQRYMAGELTFLGQNAPKGSCAPTPWWVWGPLHRRLLGSGAHATKTQSKSCGRRSLTSMNA